MRNVFIAIVLWLGSASASFCSGEGFKWIFRGYPLEGVEYTFTVPLGEKDRWDSVSQETPPLSPGKALRLARDYIEKIAPLSKEPIPFPFPAMPGENTPRSTYITWEVSDVRLLRYVNAAGHEHWIYVVSIDKMMKGVGRTMSRPDMQVPVRMDGSIPEPVISKPNPPGGASGRQPSGSETNRTSSAAGSRRSP